MKIIHQLPFGAALFALFLGSDLAFAQVYKWVDENGKVHYSDKPQDQNATELKIDTKISPEQQAEAKKRAQQLVQMQQRRVNNQLENEEERQQAAIKAEQEQQKLATACAYAREELRILNQQVPVYTLDDKGERQYMDDKKRAEQKQHLQAQITEHCNQD